MGDSLEDLWKWLSLIIEECEGGIMVCDEHEDEDDSTCCPMGKIAQAKVVSLAPV